MKDLLKAIYIDFGDDIYRYFYKLSLNPALSEDLTSDVFLEALKSIHHYRGDGSLKAWLFSIARHRWYHYLRSKKNELVLLSENLEDIAENICLERNISQKEAVDFIKNFLKNEPERTQDIIKMRIEGFSYCEIGEKLNISENSARVIEFRTKNKLKQLLDKEGFTYD